MKNLFKFIGILALTTVIGFSMITCAAETEDAAGGLAVGFFSPDYNTKYVKAEGIVPAVEEDLAADPPVEAAPMIHIIAASSYTANKPAKLGQIQNNSAVLSVWNINGKAYTGDGDVNLKIYIYAAATDTDPAFEATFTDPVVFVGGVAAVDFNDATVTEYVAPTP